MNDFGLVLIIIIGFLLSLSFLSRTIIEPYIKNKKGESVKFNKIKIILSIIYFIFFVIISVLVFSGIIVYHE